MSVSERSFFEPRFGADFSKVRIHNNAKAANATRAVSARAFTLGHDIVFGAGEFSSSSSLDRKLFAHELTHFIQQSGRMEPVVQRTLVVEDPRDKIPNSTTRENWEDVELYMNEITPGFRVNPSGPVTPTFNCVGPLNTTSQCLCDLHNSANLVPWKIKITDIDWPHTEEANRRVTTHSTNSIFEFGSWGGGASAGTRTTASNARVLAHELCGHAWLMEQGIHPARNIITTGTGSPMARPHHDPTIDIENQVAREMYGPGAQERGTFRANDPHYGESLIRLRGSGWDLNRFEVHELPPDQQTRIWTLRNQMLREPSLMADVIGHADHTGGTGSAINDTISRNRAIRVRDWLVGQGINASRFRSARGANNSQCPLMPANNPDCRGVDIYLFNYEAGSESFVNPNPRPTP